MKRPAFAIGAMGIALALSGCDLVPGNDSAPRDRFEDIIEASGAGGVYYASANEDEFTAVVHVGDMIEAWRATEDGEPRALASGSQVGSVDIAGWSAGIPLEWFVPAETAIAAFEAIPECSDVLDAELEAVGAAHQLTWLTCGDSMASEIQVPTFFYDGAPVEPGRWDLTDPTQLEGAITTALDVIGDDEAALVSLRFNEADGKGTGTLDVRGAREAIDETEAVCQPLFIYNETVTWSTVPYRTDCNDVEPVFTPLPAPFDPDLALRLWRDAGGSRDTVGTIEYVVSPELGEAVYEINVDSELSSYLSDGTPYTY